MSRTETRNALAGLVASVCKKDRITKQDLARIALLTMKYLEDFELTWAIVSARSAFMSYMSPHIVMLDCYKNASEKDVATLTLHLRYAIVKVKFEENEIVSTTISFVGDNE